MAIRRINDPVEARVVGQQAPEVQAPQFGGLSNTLNAWMQRETQQLEQRATANVQEQAELAQREAGSGEMVQAPESLARRFQVAYEDQARTVLDQQVKRDASAEASRLRREYWNNPQGFADAWDSFATGLSEGYREADPVAAGRVQDYLDAFGTQNYDVLADEDAARQRQSMATNALEALNEGAAARQDVLLQDPNDTDYETALADYEDGVLDLVERGMITSDAGRQLVQQNQRSTTREFVRGKFQTALQRGDYRGAQGVIKSLSRGEWFPDNDQARQLAGELSRQLDTGASAKSQVPVLLKELDREYSAVVDGGDPQLSRERLTQLGRMVMAYGTPSQQDDYRTKAASIAYVNAFRDVAKGASEEELVQAGAQLDTLRQQLTPEARGALEGVIKDQAEALSKARRQGDPVLAGPRVDWSQDPSVVLQEVEARAELVAHRTGVPVGRQPTWSREEMSGMRENLERAMDAGDVDTASTILTSYFVPSEGDPARRLADLARLSNGSGDMYLAATMHGFGAPSESLRFTNLVASGREAPPDFLASIDPSYSRADVTSRVLGGGFFGDGVLNAIDNIAMGNQRVRASMASAAVDAYQGALLENGGDRSAALDEVTRLFQPLSSGVEFANGKRLASNFLAGFPAGDRAVAETVDRYLETPSLLGIPEANSEMTSRLVPMPLPGGTDLGFFDPLSGEYLADPDNPTDPLRVVPGEVVEERGVSPDDPGLVERAAEGFEAGFEASFGQAGELLDVTRLHRASAAAGVPKGELEGVFFGAEDVSPEQAGPRVGRMLLQPVWEAEFTEEQVRRRMVDTYGNTGNLADASIYTAEAQIPYASLVMEETQKAFPDDPEAQLAMYWLGPNATQELVQTYGQDWLSYVDVDTEMFISRANDVYQSRPEGTQVGAGAAEALKAYGEGATALPRAILDIGTSPYRALLEASREAAKRRRARRDNDGG
ncbi:MAG: hypothetical protein K0U78_13525 [Actinomycetia bacterium]|nr:hypothetical protein [Actinomycetes bacterium]